MEIKLFCLIDILSCLFPALESETNSFQLLSQISFSSFFFFLSLSSLSVSLSSSMQSNRSLSVWKLFNLQAAAF